MMQCDEWKLPKSYLKPYGICPNCKQENAVIIREEDDGYELFCDKCGGPLWVKK